MATCIFISEVACCVGFHSCKYKMYGNTHVCTFLQSIIYWIELNWIESNGMELNQIELIWYDMIGKGTLIYACIGYVKHSFYYSHEQGITIMGYVGLEIWIWAQ